MKKERSKNREPQNDQKPMEKEENRNKYALATLSFRLNVVKTRIDSCPV